FRSHFSRIFPPFYTDFGSFVSVFIIKGKISWQFNFFSFECLVDGKIEWASFCNGLVNEFIGEAIVYQLGSKIFYGFIVPASVYCFEFLIFIEKRQGFEPFEVIFVFFLSVLKLFKCFVVLNYIFDEMFSEVSAFGFGEMEAKCIVFMISH